jgi:hypothetical protein
MHVVDYHDTNHPTNTFNIFYKYSINIFPKVYKILKKIGFVFLNA